MSNQTSFGKYREKSSSVISSVRYFYFPFFLSLPSSGTFPIDLTKTRLQVQGQSQYTEVRYRGMFHALFRIGKEEGIRALYSGYGNGFSFILKYIFFYFKSACCQLAST